MPEGTRLRVLRGPRSVSFNPELKIGKQEIEYGTESSGVKVEYTKRRRSVCMWGWYNHYVGMDPLTIGLRELLDALEVSDRDLRVVIRDRAKGE